jgi:hypothetical protein
MRNDEDLVFIQRPVIDLDAPSTTYRIGVDVDMVPAGMTAEQACGVFIAALESAYAAVRSVRINQCSTLTREGMHRRSV